MCLIKKGEQVEENYNISIYHSLYILSYRVSLVLINQASLVFCFLKLFLGGKFSILNAWQR